MFKISFKKEKKETICMISRLVLEVCCICIKITLSSYHWYHFLLQGAEREYADKCRQVTLSNAVTCLLTPEVYNEQDTHQQMIDILLDTFHDGGKLVCFFPFFIQEQSQCYLFSLSISFMGRSEQFDHILTRCKCCERTVTK